MLAYLLASIVAIGSLAIYMAAFFFPEIHRKNDFVWSGIGFFYALVLWIFAPRITGGLLLGHVASVALLVWFGWQTLSLRRQLTPEIQQTPIPSPELVKVSIQEQVSKFSLQQKLGQLLAFIGNLFSNSKSKTTPTEKTAVSQPSTTPTTKPAVTIIDHTAPTTEESETVPEVIPPNPPAPELVEAAQPQPEAKLTIPVEEIAPDAVLAPPAEVPPEETQATKS
ncbi:Ycf66 family protein [Richelia sinica]|nr:Ycf66 family protein [Richelia sinica]MBD2666084.1 hypothetical protein [Richelia sinica FACHB-800]